MKEDTARVESAGEWQEPLDMGPVVADADDAAVSRFADGVKRAIHRRLFGASVVEFCVLGPGVVAVGLLVGVAGCWGARGRGPERKGEGK